MPKQALSDFRIQTHRSIMTFGYNSMRAFSLSTIAKRIWYHLKADWLYWLRAERKISIFWIPPQVYNKSTWLFFKQWHFFPFPSELWVHIWQWAVILIRRRLSSILNFHIKQQRVSRSVPNYTRSFKVQELWLSTAYLTISGPKRSSCLKQYTKGAGFIFLHESLICHSTQLPSRNLPPLPNTNEEAREHMWAVASLTACHSQHMLSLKEVPN
jgi:hypothetical protein